MIIYMHEQVSLFGNEIQNYRGRRGSIWMKFGNWWDRFHDNYRSDEELTQLSDHREIDIDFEQYGGHCLQTEIWRFT